MIEWLALQFCADLVLKFPDFFSQLISVQVFISGPETVGESPEKLEREAKVKVFDYKKFHSHLEQYFKGGRSKKPEVITIHFESDICINYVVYLERNLSGIEITHTKW